MNMTSPRKRRPKRANHSQSAASVAQAESSELKRTAWAALPILGDQISDPRRACAWNSDPSAGGRLPPRVVQAGSSDLRR
jgi:hypothetical protein